MASVDERLGDVNKAIEAGLALVPNALLAYRLLFQIWQVTNPTGTFQDFNNYLRTEAKQVGDFSRDWYAAHGYVEDPPGSNNWKKQDAPQPPPPAQG